MRNILFLVTGMTPQIITETVWALACDPNKADKWIPDEIRVLSTQNGLNQIQGRLLKNGVFSQFKEDYPQLKSIVFDENSLIVVKDSEQQSLDDIKTPQHNEVMANTLCELIRGLTEQEDTSLHVSIAGGRKTMGYYAGYALSIYGRHQDSMSHVLVEEAFEKAIDFFYPTPQPSYAHNVDKIIIGNAQNAKVWLAEIPFVRMREMLDNESIVTNKSFSDVIEIIEQSIFPIMLRITNNDERTIFIADKSCKLSPKEFCLYLLAAEMRLANETLSYPSKDIAGDTIQPVAQSRFNELYRQHKSKNVQEQIVVDYDYFSNALSTMRRKFKIAFGEKIAKDIAIQRDTKASGFGLLLSADNISISNNI